MFTRSRIFILSLCLAFSIIVEAGALPQEKSAEKLDLFEAIEVASQHCLKIAEKVKMPYDLRSAYITHYKNQDFGKKFTDAQKQDLISYFEGRPDLPDFTFLIPDYQTTIDRKNKINFNALQTLEVLEKFNFDVEAFPFADNCKMEEFKPDIHKLILNTVIAFGTNQHKLTYTMLHPKGFSWQIDDIAIDGQSLAQAHRIAYTDEIAFAGFDKFIEGLCKASSFSKVGCAN